MNNELKNYYQILGITYNASMKNIEAARERELKENWSNPIGRLEVEEAFKVLSNPATRREYDIQLKQYLTEKQIARENARTSSEFEQVRERYGVEEPKVEEPKVEEPKVEEPKIEEPKVEEPKIEEPKIEEPKIEEITGIPVTRYNYGQEKQQTDSNQLDLEQIETLSGLAKWSVVGVTTVATMLLVGGPIVGAVIGVPAGVLIGEFIEKKIKKSSLQKESMVGKITEVKTPEIQLIDEKNKELEDKIYELLSKPGKNYELEIAKLRYENQLALLGKRIELKRNTKVKDGVLIAALNIFGLETKYKLLEKKFKLVNSQIDTYKKESKLSKLNKEVIDLSEKVQLAETKEKQAEKEGKSLSLDEIKAMDKSKIKFTSKLDKRDDIANKMVLHRNGISRKVLLAAFYNKIKEKISGDEPNVRNEEESVKTR